MGAGGGPLKGIETHRQIHMFVQWTRRGPGVPDLASAPEPHCMTLGKALRLWAPGLLVEGVEGLREGSSRGPASCRAVC